MMRVNWISKQGRNNLRARVANKWEALTSLIQAWNRFKQVLTKKFFHSSNQNRNNLQQSSPWSSPNNQSLSHKSPLHTSLKMCFRVKVFLFWTDSKALLLPTISTKTMKLISSFLVLPRWDNCHCFKIRSKMTHMVVYGSQRITKTWKVLRLPNQASNSWT